MAVASSVLLSFLIFFFLGAVLCVPPAASSFRRLPLPPPALGPEAYAFDSRGQGPYTGVADGRILKYQNPAVGFRDYAFSSATRPKVCDGYVDPALGPKCGRPLGIGFNYFTGELWIADAYLGLLVVGKGGGAARQLVTGAGGVPFRLLDGLDIHQPTGVVYLTDASANFGISEIAQAVAVNDASGRLLAYDPRTRATTVLKQGLSGPAGVTVSIDGSYLVFTEYIAKRVQRFWLRGPRANTSEILVTFQGRPDNIKRTTENGGDHYYLVAVNVQTPSGSASVPTAVRIDPNGNVLTSVSLSDRYGTTQISEVQEYYRGRYFVGSMATDFVGVYNFFI